MGALRHDMRQHWRASPGAGWRDLLAYHSQQGPGGAFRRLPLIDMRIGLVAGDDLRIGDHGVEDVGVHVIGDAQRRDRIDRADAAQQLALSVVEMFSDHGAVQVQPDAVEAALGHLIQDQAAEGFIGLPVHRAAGGRAGADRHHHTSAPSSAATAR